MLPESVFNSISSYQGRSLKWTHFHMSNGKRHDTIFMGQHNSVVYSAMIRTNQQMTCMDVYLYGSDIQLILTPTLPVIYGLKAYKAHKALGLYCCHKYPMVTTIKKLKMKKNI